MPKAALRNAATSANAGGDLPEHRRTGREPDDTDHAKTKPTSWANFNGGTGSLLGDRTEAGGNEVAKSSP